MQRIGFGTVGKHWQHRLFTIIAASHRGNYWLLPALVACLGLLPAPTPAAGLDFQTADFTILDAKTAAPIGSAHFQVDDTLPGREIVTSRARYSDGQYDLERDEFDLSKANELPEMSAYEHTFFRADNTLFLKSLADFRSGRAACTTNRDGKVVQTEQFFHFPPGTYAGAAMTLPLEKSLREGNRGPIKMHDFVCMPDPHLLEIKVSAQAAAPWEHYPGDLIRAKVTPAFGWVDYLIAPFVPAIYAWFNPGDNFELVGAQFSRYYKGPEVILTRRDHASEARAGSLPHQ